MPRDQRLYMTFPIDMHRHPKITRLSPGAKWAFFEMNGEARIAENDGRFSAEDAEFQWPKELLMELLHSHPVRPLLVREGTDYVIRDYAEHQFTTSDRERLAEVSRKNGAKGGRPPKPKETHAGSFETQTKPESESESGLELIPRLNTVSHLPEREAGQIDVEKVIVAVQKHCGRECTRMHAFLIVGTVMDRATVSPKNKTAFVVKAIERDPFEFQKIIDEAAAS